MSGLKEIKTSIESQYSMKGLIEVYEEMAATTMRKIRQAIVDSRDYYSGLSRLSAEIGDDFTLWQADNKKELALVFLSADDSLYGDIIDKVCSSFLPAIRKSPKADVFVVGQLGISLMQTLAPKVPIKEMSMSPNFVKSLYDYSHVQLFFGEFKSIARQEPQWRMMSANELKPDKMPVWDMETKLKYLYEPTPTEIATVFAQSIFGGLFEQANSENELAKNASRLMHLDQALTTIDHHLTMDTKKYKTTQKRVSSKKQHTQLAGYKASKNLRRIYVQ